ncbi:hypothetical protein WME90_03595 [Sorangium sp. So ce375]|uniref:hypothetical protein n=1 Tax=Sorangium sp. So ce375 TaxID=3133306 RepID=UPI003F5BE92F
MDVTCEVCGIVTTVSSDARGGAALECSVCGGAMLRAHGRGTAAPPTGGVGQRSSRPPPPLRRSSAPSVLRHDDDPTMMDLRSLALKSFITTLPAATTAPGASAASSVAPESGPAAPAADLATQQASRSAATAASTASAEVAGTTPVAVEAPSVSDVLRVYDALVPVAAPSRAGQRARVRALAAASVAGALALAVGLTLVAGRMARAPEDDVRPIAQRGVSRAGEVARGVSAPVEAPGPRRAALRGADARVAVGEDEASAAEPGAAQPSRAVASDDEASAAEPGAAQPSRAAAGVRASTASGARARPERQPPPASEEAAPSQPPVSLTDAMAAAVADTPAPAPAATQRQTDTSDE